ncbi:MAG: hypothetical protein AB7T07_15515 [Steroidobacteraceae bacterium]
MRDQEAIQALVVREIERIEQPELASLARSLRVSPRLEDRPWDYGADGQTYPCWITFAHQPSNTAIAYCSDGFGPNCPWGLLFLTEPRSMGMDSQWFASVEDTLRNCPAWKGDEPPGYEDQ